MHLRIAIAAAILCVFVACGSSPTSPSTPPATGTLGSPVSIVGGASNLTTTAYAPDTISVAVGGSVTWTNNDVTAHTSTADNGSWNSGSIPPGSKFTMTF